MHTYTHTHHAYTDTDTHTHRQPIAAPQLQRVQVAGLVTQIGKQLVAHRSPAILELHHLQSRALAALERSGHLVLAYVAAVS